MKYVVLIESVYYGNIWVCSLFCFYLSTLLRIGKEITRLLSAFAWIETRYEGKPDSKTVVNWLYLVQNLNLWFRYNNVIIYLLSDRNEVKYLQNEWKMLFYTFLDWIKWLYDVFQLYEITMYHFIFKCKRHWNSHNNLNIKMSLKC